MRAKRVSFGLVPLCLLFLILSGAVDRSLIPTGVREGYLVDAGGPTPSAVAVAHAAGEFRIVAANLLWMNVVDHYHHQFMAQGGDWSKDKDILPLLQMIVDLDPHFTEAYEVEGLILCQLGRYTEGKVVLQQSIDANPTSWQMEYDMAMLYAWYRKEPAHALPYAEKAEALAADPFFKHRVSLLCNTLHRQIQAAADKSSDKSTASSADGRAA